VEIAMFVKRELSIGPRVRALAPVSAPDAWEVRGPCSWLFVGGQLADFDGEQAVSPGDINAQTRQVFDNIARVLRDGGATWSDVIRLDAYYCYDGPEDEHREYLERIVDVAGEYLPTPGPAWGAVRVKSLAYPGLLLEVDAIAAVNAGGSA
jgi:enamine deaminase RidA (YjgF/YER057c/UK114 family)